MERSEDFEKWWAEHGEMDSRSRKDLAASAYTAGAADIRRAVLAFMKSCDALNERMSWF